MTHEILQSDIDLAKGLLQDKCPDTEILAALTRRGIDAAEAVQLVRDLHDGKRVSARSDFGEAIPIPTTLLRPLLEGPARPSGRRRTGTRAWPWVFAALVLLAVAITGAVLLSNPRYQREAVRLLDNFSGGTHESERSTSGVDDTGSAGNPHLNGGTIIELGAAGMTVVGTQLFPSNALAVLRQALGPPSRTNVVAGAAALLYAFDRHGILLSAPRDRQPDSLVLDFDGEGGESGTQSPFSGIIRIGGQQIDPQTAAATLKTNSQLSITNSLPEGGILAGQCHGFAVIFSFIKSPGRLSSIEIRFPQ